MTATVTAKVVLDGSGVAAGVAQVNSAVAQIGPAAERSVGQATHAVQEHGEAWKKCGETVMDSLKEIAAAVGLAFSVDKIIEFVGSATEGAEKIQLLSQTLGVSTQNLQAFNYIAGLTGTNLDTVSTSLTRLERAQVEARDGSVQTSAAFKSLGISVTDATGALKPADQLIVQVAQSLSKMQDGQTKAAIAIQLMGRGAADSIPFLNALGREFEELKEHAEELGLVLSAKDQASLVAFKESTNELGQEIKGLGNQFAVALLPVLTQVVGKFSEMAASGQIKSFLQDVANAAKFVVDNFNAVVQAAKILVEIQLASWLSSAVAGLKAMVVEAGEAKAATLSLGTAFTALGAGIVGWNIGTYLSEQFVEVRIAGANLVTGLQVGWELIKLGALDAWDVITAGWNTAIGLIEQGLGKLATGFQALAKVGSLALTAQGNFAGAAQLDAYATSLGNVAADYAKAGEGAGNLNEKLAANKAAFDANVASLAAANKGLIEGYEAEDKHNQSVQLAINGMQQLNEVSGHYLDTLAEGKPKLDEEKEAIENVNKVAEQLIKSGADENTVNKEKATAIKQIVQAYSDATRAQGNYNSQQEAANKLAEDQRKDLEDYDQALAALTGKLNGPYAKAQADYDIAVSKAHEAYEKAIKDHLDAGQAIEREATLTETAAAVRDREIQQLREQHDIMAQTNQDLQNQNALWGVAPQYQQAITDGLKQYDDLLKSHYDFYGKYISDEKELRAQLDSQVPSYIAMKQAINDVAAAQKNNEAISKEWQGIVANGFQSVGSTMADFITSGLHNWHDFMQGLLSDAKQFIGQIIQEFLKLEVFNGIINSLFGLTGSSALPTGLGNGILGSVFGGGGGITGAASSFFGGGNAGSLSLATDPDFLPGGALFGTDSNSAGQALSSLNSAASTGNGLMGWLFGSSNSASLLNGGVGSSLGDFTGPGTQFLNYGGEYNVTAEATQGVDQSFNAAGNYGLSEGGIGLGQVLSVAGAVFAGYNEWKASGGGVGGAAGAAAYGTAAYVGGAAVTAGVAAAVTGGIGAGVTAGLAAIGPIGWVALAAVGINMITGGKLFGTAATKFVSASQTETIGPDGASVTAQETLKGQKAFFGGSYTKTKNLAVDPAAQQGATDFYNSLISDKADFAALVGQTAGAIIGGTFTQNFDKKGNPTTTTSTVNGQTFTGETQQQFGERIEAANFSDVLTKMGINVDTFTKGVSGDADKLLAAVQDVGTTTEQAQIDIRRGLSLLGDDNSVSDVVNEVIKLNNGAETLAQTYADLQISVMSLKSDMMLASDSTGLTGKALVEFANDADKAAGGAQALSKLIQQFDAAYYSAGQQAQANIDQLKSTVSAELTGLGENPNESMAQFKKDFDAVRNSLSAADLVKWYQAGVDLASLNTAIGNLADNAQKYADFEVQTQGDDFVQSFVKAIEAEKSQIDTANQLAEAAGKAGASQADLATAVNTGTVAIGQAIATLTQGIQNDIQTLGIGAAAYDPSHDPDGVLGIYYSQQQAKAQAAAQKAQQASAAFDLIKKLGDFAFASGGNPDDVLKGFGISAEQIGSKVGETADQVRQQIAAEAAQAASLVTMAAQGQAQTGLLTDILEVLQGKPTTFDIASLSKATNTSNATQTALLDRFNGGGNTNTTTVGRQLPGQPYSPGTSAGAGTSDAKPVANTATLQTIPTVLQKNNMDLTKRLDSLNTNIVALSNCINRYGLARIK